MNQNEFGVSVSFQGRRYSFAYGSQAFIFHTGTLNGFYESYGANTLLQYVGFVHACYLDDDNHTPLGALADYIAGNWNSLRHKASREVLNEFYACHF
jgi:hypothetical protein